MMIHYPTCVGWETGRTIDCTCAGRPWSIRRSPDGWTVSRRVGTSIHPAYEKFLTCDTFPAAVQLVESMIWLAYIGLRGADA